MIIKLKYIFVYLLFMFLFSIFLFCYGFFPFSYSTSAKSSLLDLPSSLDNARLNNGSYKSRHSRIILMVIDAMRCDFVTEKTMPFLHSLIATGAACQYRLQVHPPTVTMPRIKAMTSGSIPSFLDVILNLGSAKTELDTFLYQMIQQHQRIVFYGDNTWTNMFPDIFYRKRENVDSLYVNDFYKGDENITNSMRLELLNFDWELMILHYLGLDHIGHVEGPFSGKIPSKLKEMDNVISEIVESMNRWDKRNQTAPLLLITGDHGMRDSGGHGGSTFSETNVPLLVIGNNCTRSDDLFMQIDIAPTLATLLGVAIPYSSIGSLIVPVLDDIPPIDKVYAAFYNTKRLVEKAQILSNDNVKKQDFFLQYKEAKLLHTIFLEHEDDLTILNKAINKYSTISRNLSALLIKNYIRYDEFSMLLGICLGVLTSTLSILLVFLPQNISEIKIQLNLVPIVAVLATLSFTKYFIFKLDLIGLAILQNFYSYHSLLVCIFCCLYIYWSVFKSIISFIKKNRVQCHQATPPISCLVLGFSFHAISSCSSSFIEEEHLIWYYFCSTLFLLMTILELKKLNRVIEKLKLSRRANEGFLNNFLWERHLFCIKSVLFLCGHILLRRLNQTGDKWQHLADIGDWLNKDEHKSPLSVVLVFALCSTVYAIGRFAGVLTTILSATACFLVYYYRLMAGLVAFFGIIPTKTNNCLTIFWINLVEIFAISLLPKLYNAIIKTKKDSSSILVSVITITALLSTLLHKPHNVILVAALLSSSRYLVTRIDNVSESKLESLLLKIGSHIWLGKLFYFYQGNSNNLATIDLNAGYVGLSSFSFWRVGLLLLLNTYHGQILSFLMLLYHLENGHRHKFANKLIQDEQRKQTISNWFLKLYSIANIIPLTFYVIVVAFMRNHIFVWTVFSPKLIYECVHITLTMIEMLVAIFFLK
ncbi:GPI ethanolamine phosphate transferase 2 [Wyeomyia smithii]|uniref:GPI ethanolamine phosphate transferase 2 n=1 Tax=Wyeomyia smithii TaxID=174621 RepID=UPI002467EC9F|nr:GPI ethanolamine phosphate transferase 2 [Wyeomyia smithii]